MQSTFIKFFHVDLHKVLFLLREYHGRCKNNVVNTRGTNTLSVTCKEEGNKDNEVP